MCNKRNYYIKIYDESSAIIPNVNASAIQREYLSGLFSKTLALSDAVIVYFVYPKSSSTELQQYLEEIACYCRKFKVSKYYKDLPQYCSFSITNDNKSKLETLVNLLTQAWIFYDWTEIYFATDKNSLELKERIITKSRIKYAFGNHRLKDFIGYCKSSTEDTDIIVHKDCDITFDKIFTPDPTLELDRSLLYNITYSDDIIKSKNLIDSLLNELGFKNLFENDVFEIDFRSYENFLQFNLTKPNSVSLEIFFYDDCIFFNIDRVFEAIQTFNNEDAKEFIKNRLKAILYSKIRVEYKGDRSTKVLFLDKDNNTIDTISKHFFSLSHIFNKKEVYEYDSIYKK